MRIVLRIGGSVVASPLDTELVKKYVILLEDLKRRRHEVVAVIGGGSLAREFISKTKELGLGEQSQDTVAISVSRLFAQIFFHKLGGQDCAKLASTLDEAAEGLAKGKIVVMGGLKPGITTDAVAALVAERIGANLLVKGTNQNGVFNMDPVKNPKAVKLDTISFDDLSRFFSESKHKAGIHQIIDPEAIKILKRNRVKLVVANGFKPKNLLLAVEGKKVGTIIT